MAVVTSEARAKAPAGLDGVLSMAPSPRVERMREAFFNIKPTVSIEWARIEARVMKESAGEPMITRRAKVFAAVVREMPIDIFTDELLAGYPSVGPRCANVNPMNALSIGRARSRAAERSGAQTGLSDEEETELEQELIPFWQEQGRIGKAAHYHYGHNVHGMEKVLKKGFLGIKEEAEERLARLDPAEPEDLKKAPFLEGVVMAMEAASELGQRFAARARELSEKEEDAKRKAELLRIAEVCDWVPAHPARTFYEALQSYHFAWLMLVWEISYDMGYSLGRLDQYLYPYYARDIEEGRITEEEAQELIDCYILKLNKAGGSFPIASIGVGGVKANGDDATNALSYILIEAIMHTRLITPYFALHVHSKTPDALLIKACQLCSLGTGHPQFLNTDIMVAQALARGSSGGPPMTLADARSATNVGCIELVVPGKDSGYCYYTGSVNLGTALELALTNGLRRMDNKKMGLETGDPRQFKSFEEVLEAYGKQVAWMRRNIQIAGSRNERNIIELSPTVYESALIENCIEKGICREEGGAHYNFNTGSVVSASTDVGDSLTAIKKLVFEDEKMTMAELCDALDHDFEGYDDIRKMCLAVPKFGNDDDYADEQVAWTLHNWVSEFTQLKNLRGGGGSPGGSPMWRYIPEGEVVGALPSGRLAGEPLADAASPSAGKDRNGPTAVLKSMGKVDHVEILGGVILNMRMDPSVFTHRDGIKRLADMIRTFIDQKVFHVQINVVSSDTLRAAQKEPEKYEDLMVKVAGYNAYFTHLGKPLQDSIIARTAHGF